MGQILTVDNNTVRVGADDGKIVTVPITAVNYQNPKVGDPVTVYQDGDKVIIAWAGANGANGAQGGNGAPYVPGAKTTQINKHLFVWLGAFLFGGFGVDRFMRGQVGLGIVKLLFGWITLGIWPFVDFIIALVKVYGGTFNGTDNATFINGKYPR